MLTCRYAAYRSPWQGNLLAEIVKVSTQDPERPPLEYAASLIHIGKVIAIPTDTFYGLAADPFNLNAVQQVYAIKGRPERKALPILVRSLEQAEGLAAGLPEAFYMLARRFWPGALTIVVDASQKIPLKVTGNTGRVALRWPNSSVACKLIETADLPVTGTSANLSGFAACVNANQVVKQLGDRLPLVLDGGESKALLPSTIVELRGSAWHVVREGAIPEQEIRDTLAGL